MKYLLLIIQFVFTFNAIYSQKNNENTIGSSERPIVKSKSNIRNNRAIKNKDFCVFFNSNVDTLFIEISALKEDGKSAAISILNSNENEIFKLKTSDFLNAIPIPNYSSGNYYLKLKIQKNTFKEPFEIPMKN
jgi:hypothetical protein